jgi:hypothetical protein
MILPIALDSEDPWEVEPDYELVEFSSSVAAQAGTSPMLMLAPASTPICGTVWNPPGRDIHAEVERLHQLQHVPLLLAPAPAQEQPAPELTRKGRGQTKVAAAPANADELATGGRPGEKASNSRAKGGTRNAKPKQSKGDADAVVIAPRRGRKSRV